MKSERKQMWLEKGLGVRDLTDEELEQILKDLRNAPEGLKSLMQFEQHVEEWSLRKGIWITKALLLRVINECDQLDDEGTLALVDVDDLLKRLGFR